MPLIRAASNGTGFAEIVRAVRRIPKDSRKRELGPNRSVPDGCREHFTPILRVAAAGFVMAAVFAGCERSTPAPVSSPRTDPETERMVSRLRNASTAGGYFKFDLRSEIDTIPGVGPRRRKALLTAFGSVAGVRRATREDLVRVVGVKCAAAVLAYFASR